MNSNRYIKIILSLGILLLANSCSEDFLIREPLDQRTELNFYATESDAAEALVSIYDVLQWNTVVGFHPFEMLSDIASDDTYAGGASRTDAPNIIEIDRHNIRTTNPEVHGMWRKYYIGIYRANLYLEKIEGIEASDAFKARTIAEAKFLRGYFYFDLIRFFGAVPLITQTLEPSEYNQPQSSAADVFNQIAKDLYEAIDGLPETISDNELGRISKWAAKAQLAKVFLFYNGKFNANLQAGNTTINAAIALEQLNTLIEESGHDLLANYANNFRRDYQFSEESVFEIVYSDSRPWWDWGYIHGGEGNIAAQMQGPRVEEPALEQFDRGWGFNIPTQELVDAFEPNDPRFASTFIFEDDFVGGITKGYQHTGYFSRKYTTHKEYRGSTGQPELNFGNNYRVIRFSDVLLMAAELQHLTGGNTAAAQPYFNRVRERVGLGEKPATLENIYQERRVELALEGHRYWDLLRRGTNIAAERISISGSRGPRYVGDQPDFDIVFNAATDGLFPIPQSEVDLAAGQFSQNNGY